MVPLAYFVYILTNKQKSVLYVGVTNNLHRRLMEHRAKRIVGFTSAYEIRYLIYYEMTQDVWNALGREKQIKRWSRKKKEWLIGLMNPRWEDLAEGFQDEDFSTSSK